MSETFDVGNSVTVWRGKEPEAIHKVVRVLKRFVELDNGDKWMPDGWRRYGEASDRFYTGPHLRLTKPDDETTVKKLELKRYIRTRVYNGLLDMLSLESLELIAGCFHGVGK